MVPLRRSTSTSRSNVLAGVASSLLVSAMTCTAELARADEEPPVSIVVTGPATSSFTSSAKEGERPRDAADTAALLEGLPGVRVRRLGAEGGFATVSIRGAASNQIAVVFAGVPLTGAADPSLDLATIPLWPGATLHAFRTFAPASLGGGYLGGVVSVDPIAFGDRARTEVYDALGSFGAYRLRIADVRPLFGDAARDGWRVATGLSASRIEGGFPYVDPTLGPGREIDRTRTNADSAQVAAVVQARRDVDSWTFLVTSLASTRRDGVAGTFRRPTEATRLFRDRELFAIEARHRDDDGRLLTRVWLRREGSRFEDPLGEVGFGFAGTARTRVLAEGALVGRSVQLGERLTVDARLDQEVENADGAGIFGPSPSRRRARFGLSLDATWRATDALTVLAAGRVDLRRDVQIDGGATTEALPVAHLGAEQALTDWLSLAGHAGVLARPPSFLELLGDGGAIEASPGLRSERAFAFDLGLRARGRAGPWSFDGEVVGFVSRIEELIVIAPRGIGTLRAENVGRAFLGGGELSLGAMLAPFRLVGSYTLLVTRDLTSIAASRGEPLPGRPAHDLTLDLSGKFGPFGARYGLDVVSATALNRETTLTLPTRAWHSVGVSYKVGRGVLLLGEISNLFDQRSGDVVYASGPPLQTTRYPSSDFVGYPIPGRRWTLAVRGTL